MSHHEESQCCHDNSDSCSDAKSIVALIAVVVITVCFWLIGQ